MTMQTSARMHSITGYFGGGRGVVALEPMVSFERVRASL